MGLFVLASSGRQRHAVKALDLKMAALATSPVSKFMRSTSTKNDTKGK
jgi:hypothetical protein